MTRFRYVDLAGAEPAEAVVVIDVLRAVTVEAWMYARGARRVLAVSSRQYAARLRDARLSSALLAGEQSGRRVEGFDLGNSPSEVSRHDLTGAVIVHRTSAGTQGLTRTVGSRLVLAAALVNAGATARALRAASVDEVTFVITGASLGRDGDEDLAAAELIAARVRGEDPDTAAFVARVRASDAARPFHDDTQQWAPAADLAMACEVDRFTTPLTAHPAEEPDVVEVRAGAGPPAG